MNTETNPELPPDSPPNKTKPRWKRLLRVEWRWLHHRRVIILAALLLPFVACAIPTAIFYHQYAKSIDDRLRGGLFQASVNIYAAPLILTTGDALSAPDLISELHVAGYEENATGKPSTFQTSPGRIRIVNSEGTPARVTFRDNQLGDNQIDRIESGGQTVQTWNAGYPLIANLSAGREKRRLITYEEIPQVLINAVVSAEDKHFFHHVGLDLPRVLKAAWVDFRDGRKEQGASTLTMQLVRGLWLQPEKRWKRKVAEAAMTIHLERKWSKQKIFEAYTNEVYLGRQMAYSIHGFAEGAQVFFGKELQDISLPEAALLAGMVQRPSYLNPFRNPAKTKDRRDLVLLMMRQNRYISDDQYRDAVATPLHMAERQERDDTFGSQYFLDLVNDELQSPDRQEDGAKEVYTTLDLNLQRAANDALEAGMKQVDALVSKRPGKPGVPAALPEAVLIAIDPHSGEIKALIGGRNYAKSQLDRVLANRPPGSVFKPFVYAAAMNTAIEGGANVLTLASTVTDEPSAFQFDGKTYTPSNFHNEVFGTLTLRQALAKSDNVAAVKVAQTVGFDNVVAMARRAGLNNNIKPTPSVALGTYDVTPLEMTGAWTAFANGGMTVKPIMVSSVRGSDGGVVHSAQQETRQAMDPRVAYLMVSMLQEVMKSGTAAGVRSRGFVLPAAGKTGTSHDGWFAGFTSQLLCIVWVGYDDYRELNIEGAKSALPIWTEFMKRASRMGAYRNAREFSQPGGIVSARICPQSGKLAGDLCPNPASEVFIVGSEPTVPCDIHVATPTPETDETTGAPAALPPTPPAPTPPQVSPPQPTPPQPQTQP